MFNPNDITFEYDKSMIGKAYLKDLHIYIVTGYDFFKKTYLLRTTDTNNYYTGIYLEANEQRMKDIKPLPELISDIDAEIERNNAVVQAHEALIVSTRLEKNQNICANNILCRVVETHNNVRDLETLAGYKNMSREDRDFYLKEKAKAEKGFRRSKKLLYRYLSKQSVEAILDYYESNNYKNNIEHVVWKNRKLLELKESINKLIKESAING